MTETTQPTQEEVLTEFGITNEDLQRAQQGLFNHTFFEMWELALDSHIESTRAPLSIDQCSAILQGYPYLTHADVQAYRQLRVGFLERARNELNLVLGKNKKKILKEVGEVDWEKHSKLYIELLGAWTNMLNEFEEHWTEMAEAGTVDPVFQAAIIDVSTMLLDKEYGFMEALRNLHGFEYTEELKELYNKLTGSDDE